MNDQKKSNYLDYLPEIYRESDFLGRFLVIFEEIISGVEGQLERSCDIIDPAAAPVEFLDWLAGWAALELPGDWPEEVKRSLIPRIIQLYKKRGTLDGLLEFLEIYIGPGVTVDERYWPFRLGMTSTVGKDTAVGGGMPGFFKVTVDFTETDIHRKAKTEKELRTIIDREKPAHTYYHLDIIFPPVQLGVHSTIGRDMILRKSKVQRSP